MNSQPSAIHDLPLLTRLDQLGLLILEGVDAVPFLQGQTTCDVEGLAEDCISFGAFCNPKGRAVAVFRLLRHGCRFFLILRDDMLDSVRARLQRYVLRARVELSDAREQWAILGLLGPIGASSLDALGLSEFPPPGHSAAAADGILALTVDRNDKHLLIAPRIVASALESAWSERGIARYGSASEWDCAEIQDRIPVVAPATSEEFIPQMLNLDRLGGISFNKGCYTGQEVVARTHYLGAVKRRMHRFRVDCDRLPEPGARLVDARDEHLIGQVIVAAPGADSGYELLAVTNAETGPDQAVHLWSSDGPQLRCVESPDLEPMSTAEGSH